MFENPPTINSLHELGAKEKIEEYLLLIYGRISQEMIITAIRLAEDKLLLEKFPRQTITRMKIISAELLQNMVKHQVKNDSHPPYFILGFKDTALHIITGNLVTGKCYEALSRRIEEYKKIKPEELKNYYIETFKKAEISEEGNAGLGILDIMYRADQNISYRSTPAVDGLLALEMRVIINPGTHQNHGK
jgi:anti-sigma regulatory factor (Ser/Thr protein kinase)